MNEHDSPLARAVIGAAIKVHKTLGAGFPEIQYQRAMEIELELRGIGFKAEHEVHLLYEKRSIGEGRVDLLVEDQLVVELKAVENLHSAYKGQVLLYLQSLGLPRGLLINFQEARLIDGVRRVLNT